MFYITSDPVNGPAGASWAGIGDFAIWSTKREIHPSGEDNSYGNYNFSNDRTKITYDNGTDIFIADWPGREAIEAGGTITNERNLTQWDNPAPGPWHNSHEPQFNADDTKIFFKTKYIPDSTNINESDWFLQYSYINPEQVTYDPDMAHPPTYKYWVLRVPVSFPEYT